MPAPVAVVLTLARFDQQTANVVRTVAACGAPVVAVPYLAADEAAVRACCEPLGIAVVPAPPHAAFGGAANAGAAAASGDALAFVDGAEPMGPGWLPTLLAALAAAGGGVAGPHLTTDGGAGEECGFLASAAPLSARGFSLQGYSGVHVRIDVDAVSRDCMLTARATFDELGGFAETFGSRLEGLDYCLRVRESGRRVIFEPAAAFTRHGAPVPHGEQRPEGERAFFERWRERVEPHENLWPELTKSLLRRTFHSVGILVERVPIPPIAVLVHGNVPASPDFARRLFASRLQPTDVVWAAGGVAPPGTRPAVGDAAAAARGMTERRGSDLVAFVRTDTALASDWLNELVNVLERAPDTVAATIAEPWTSSEMPATADARCTLVAPRLIPQHLRIAAGAPMDAALAAWLGNAVDAGRDIARVRRTATVVAPDRSCRFPHAAPVSFVSAGETFASIVMLSWNAPDYTESAVASIRQRTRVPHEIIIVDNGSSPEALERVKKIDGIRLIENAVNTGFAFACNQGLAAARGTHAVLLNNDVIVTDGWLEALLDVQRRNPAVGCSAPRTNRIAGRQQIDDVPYRDLAGLPAFAAQRAREWRGRWTREFRVVGFCMCLDRRVVEEIGGLDPRYGTGNFEDDDYCMRIRAAGYDIAVCEDSFIHHFGNVSFRENNVDYNATFARNKAIFGQRWNVTYAGDSYDARYPFRRGFVRERDFVPLPAPAGVGADWVRSE